MHSSATKSSTVGNVIFSIGDRRSQRIVSMFYGDYIPTTPEEYLEDTGLGNCTLSQGSALMGAARLVSAQCAWFASMKNGTETYARAPKRACFDIETETGC